MSENGSVQKESKDKRNRANLWNVTYNVYYDAYYQELLSDVLATIWLRIDVITRLIVACTASGSVMAGWSLWTQNPFKIVWVSTAGVAALLSVVHSVIGIPDRLRDQSEMKGFFASLRSDIERFRSQMDVLPDLSIDKLCHEYDIYHRKYTDLLGRSRGDIFIRQKLLERVQDRLDERLKTIKVTY